MLAFCLAFWLPAVESRPESGPESWQETWTDDHAAICYYESEAYVVAPPPGWGDLPDTAAGFGLCGMYTPDRADFHGAPAIIYPRVVAPPPGEADPAGALAERSRRQLSALPGGENTVLRKADSVTSAGGLEFELFFIDNGPQPNNYELLACHAGDESILLLVLSATEREERDRFVPDLMRMLDGIFLMRVRQGGAN